MTDLLMLSTLKHKLVSSALSSAWSAVSRGIADLQRQKQDRALSVLVDAFCEIDGLEPVEAENRLAEILTSATPGVPDPHETLYESFRSMAANRSEAAWPYIARLTANYLQERKASDSFFRRTGELLERCEKEDIASIVEACRKSATILNMDNKIHGLRWCAHNEAGIAVYAEKNLSHSGTSKGHTSTALAHNKDVVNLIANARLGLPEPGENGVYFPIGGYISQLIWLFSLPNISR